MLSNMRRVLLLLGLLLFSLPVFGQGIHYTNTFTSPGGGPLAGIHVAVCSPRANLKVFPCTPATSIYLDETLTTSQTNPFKTSSTGSYSFWAAPGHYVIQLYGGGITSQTIDVFLPCDASAGRFCGTGSGAAKPVTADAVFYVTKEGSDSNDGLSWGTAKATVSAAITAMGATAGVITVAGNVPETDQISVPGGDRLQVDGSLTISQPILLGAYATLSCLTDGQNGAANGQIRAAANMADMVQAATQDGATEAAYVENCQFNGNFQTFPSGIINITGLNDRAQFAHLLIFGYSGGPAFYGTAGTNFTTSNFSIRDIWANPGVGTAASTCIAFSASGGYFDDFTIEDFECQNPSGRYPISFTNTNATYSNLMRGAALRHIVINGGTYGTNGAYIYVNGASAMDMQDVSCDSGEASCVEIAHNGNNWDDDFRSITVLSGTANTLKDDLNSVTIAGSATPHIVEYSLYNAAFSPAHSETWANVPINTLSGPLFSAGTVTLVSGAGSHTFTKAYSTTPVCTATDTTAAKAVQVTVSTTAITFGGTGSDVISWICTSAAN